MGLLDLPCWSPIVMSADTFPKSTHDSVKNGQKIFGLLKALGTAGMPDINEARQNLLKAINDPAKMEEVKIGVEEQREHFDNLNLHIGYVYGDTHIPSHASHFRPSFRLGVRLPHAWLQGSSPTTVPQLKPVNLKYVKALTLDQILVILYVVSAYNSSPNATRFGSKF